MSDGPNVAAPSGFAVKNIKRKSKSSHKRTLKKKCLSGEINDIKDELQESPMKKMKILTNIGSSTSEGRLSVSGRSKPALAVKKRPRKETLMKRKSLKLDSKTIRKPKKSSVFERITLNAQGKPNWKSIKKETFELKKQRKEKKQANYDAIIEAKKIWELVRRDNCPVEKKAEYVVSLYTLVQNHLSKMVYAHDTSRIIQWLIQLGSPQIRASICETLTPQVVEMSQNKFSVFCVKKLLKCGDKTSIGNVINTLQANVMKLVTNSVAAPLLEYVYSQHATAEQRKSMEQEFFGQIYKITVGHEAKTLKDSISTSAENRNSILQETKENIIRIINKLDFTFNLLYNVTLQFFDVCSQEDRQEILDLLCPHVLDLATTKAGSRLGMQCVWYSPKKVKKGIIQLLKGHVSEMCMMEDGHWIILALLDSVDDTVLLKKVIIREIVENVTTIITNESGRKVVLYLVVHRDTVYFHPKDIAILEQGDISGTSLKSMNVRRSELSPVINTFLQSVIAEVNVWMQDPKVAMVTLAALKKGTGDDLRKALNAVAIHVCSDARIDNLPLIQNAGINFVLKKLFKFDETQHDVEDTFSFYLASTLEENTIKKWVTCNRACFLLAGILEVKKVESVTTLLKKLKPGIQELIKEQGSIGATVLNKAITAFEA